MACLYDLKPFESNLSSARGNNFPLFLRIDSVVPPSEMSSSQIIYCILLREKNQYKVKILKQKSIIAGNVYEMEEVYGIDKGAENSECVVCLYQPRNTMLLPCKHVCLCIDCAEALAKNSTPCPICRGKVTTFSKMQIQQSISTVSYTHLRAHETSLHLVCRLLLEKKKKKKTKIHAILEQQTTTKRHRCLILVTS
eukprot:TRINITY_DN17090_c0_g1_i1.p1 TRINITY_DN17090_c0_g1~~TRINITY_DN17090_c0_g1_i1.p1  ORF type:complete len:196 (-),score=25.15 TRINITY_DN17090_c0_g1_i1:57-644(-)